MTALIDRWWPETHTFHLPVGEYTITLEDVTHIYGLSTDSRAISRRTDSCFAHVVDECVANFGILSGENNHVSSAIKLSWITKICNAEALTLQSLCNVMSVVTYSALLGPLCFLTSRHRW
ncbi:hypothetical protein Ahy_B04g070033 [Arachis hypogaea]|uniref:Aminotransferase-like plant mobile domain-containing protein n=1 Tax=Arachis hypogaea TaxID=3818 RepID=A0A444ZE88_ARAHY|nr:hypothetical protein Ahy_B04g070033 [Arachis hypogaea]